MLVNPTQLAPGIIFAVLEQDEYDSLEANNELDESTIYLVVENGG